jgi:pimeloyl-ACP methyl ester carboxylesterase
MIRPGRVALVLAALIVLPEAARAQPAQAPAVPPDVTFRVFARGQPIGNETVTVLTLPDGWKVMSTGQLVAPLSITTRIAEVTYDSEWRPRSLLIEGQIKDQQVSVKTTFADGRATSAIVQAGKDLSKTDAVAEKTVVLPNLIFGAYEALAARLSTAQPGTGFRVYVAPQAEIDLTLDAVSAERVSVPGRTFEARRHTVTFQNPGGPLIADIWTDGPRLMRITIASASLDVVREDVASVAARQTTNYRENDEDVRVPGNGFNLAGTLSKPPAMPPAAKGQPARLPAIVLVAGSGPTDRDETAAGIPIFAQLSSALADAGYIVLRYDKRGVGQSGGRIESATILDFAEDARAAVAFLRKRKDVATDRVALVGHSEGAAVSLLAGQREKRIAALVLVAGPGTTGAELVLEQQKHLLERSRTPPGEQESKIELQKKIQQAVVTGTGWDGIPADLRKQAESPWFKSFLEFDPARTIARVGQPVLVVQGELDTQVPPRHADLLAASANTRKNRPPAEVVKLPGINHLLVPAKTGEVDEYGSLTSRTISADLASKIVEWLGRMMAPKKS